MEEKGSHFTGGKSRPWALLPTIATLAACILSVTTIRVLRSPGLMLSELKGRRAGTEGRPWVVVGRGRPAGSWSARRKRRVWEEMGSSALCEQYKEIREYPCGIIKEIYKHGQWGKARNKNAASCCAMS